MKRINENQKVTLTLGQLKRLIREWYDEVEKPIYADMGGRLPDHWDYCDDEDDSPDWDDLSYDEQLQISKEVAEDLMKEVGEQIASVYPGAELVEDGDFDVAGLHIDNVRDLNPNVKHTNYVSILVKFPGVHNLVQPDRDGIYTSDSCELLFDITETPKLVDLNGNNPDPNAKWAIVNTKSGPVSEPECYRKCVEILEDAGYDIDDIESKIGNIIKKAFSSDNIASFSWK